MRLWSLSPKYLDAKGLGGAWREALLARKVLKGDTKGYRNHSQLIRFRATKDPIGAINEFLVCIYHESLRRNFSYDSSKLEYGKPIDKIYVSSGQVAYEASHLRKKLTVRDPARLSSLDGNTELNSIFIVVDGPIENWEKVEFS